MRVQRTSLDMTPRCIVVHEKPNPTTDFFIRHHIATLDAEPQYVSHSDTPLNTHLHGVTVIFVRYVPAAWRAVLDAQPEVPVVLFMDDNLFRARTFRGLPWRYQWKLLTKSWRHQRWLKGRAAQLWVSTPALVQEYRDWSPKLLQPANPYSHDPQHTNATPATVFYHGSASHAADIEWLVGVAQALEGQCDDVCFEIIGDQKVREKFLSINNVTVIHPMNWLSYQTFIRRPGRTIGLAPLLDTSFNRTRAPTKLYDITAAGAVGIYGQSEVYSSVIQHDDNGLLLPMDNKINWVDSILDLLGNHEKRQRLFEGAKATVATPTHDD